MKCPNCGVDGEAVVTHTTNTLGSKRRRRRCENCRSSYYTWELTEKELTTKTILKTIERLMFRRNKIAPPSK